MNKVIYKSALLSLATLAVAALLVFSLWILCSPQTMATACEKTGNYSFAVNCAELKFKYTKDAYDLSRVVEDGILSGRDKYTVKYGLKLIESDKFDEVCKEKDKNLSEISQYTVNYRGYVCGHVAAAQYRADDLEGAVETAKTGGAQSFVKLVLEIAERQDKASAQAVKSSLAEFEDTQYLIAILENLGD